MRLVKALATEKPLFEKFLDQYLGELSAHREIAVGAMDSASYPYLDLYWQEEGRLPFLIYKAEDLVGFSLIRDTKSTQTPNSQIAEFFIVPEQRGKGIGQEAVFAIFEMFPGGWEVQVHNKNEIALSFWEKCIKAKTKKEIIVSQITAADGERTQYNFEI